MPKYALLRRWRLLFLSSLIIPTVALGLTVATPASQAAQTTSSASCPQGTTYVDMGDGCMRAQASGSVQTTNFFTGFTGQSYMARPPWNVAGVDYAVGYSGTLKDPLVSGNMPACVSNAGNSSNPNLYIANGDMQPCVLDHLDFSLHGGICFMVQGNNGNTVAFSNDKFASGSSNCSLFSGFIQEDAGNNTNIVVQYSEFDDNYACQCGGELSSNATGVTLGLIYNAFVGVTARVMYGQSSLGMAYNYVNGMGNGTNGHGEVEEFGSLGALSYTDVFNTYYVASTNCCDTAVIYIENGKETGTGNSSATISAQVMFDTIVVRQGANQYNPVAAPIWIQTTQGVVIPSLNVQQNYIDANGSLVIPPIYVYPPDNNGGYIGTNACAGNKYLSTGGAITGTLGSGTSTLVCN